VSQSTKVSHADVLRFLNTEEARSLSGRQQADHLGMSEAKLRRIKSKLVNAGDHWSEAAVSDQDEAMEEASTPELLPDGSPPGIRLMALSDLDLDSGTRVRPLDDDYVKELVEVLEAMKRPSMEVFPPLRAFHVPDLGRNVLTRGFHRHQAGVDVLGDMGRVDVDLRIGGLKEAIEDAWQDNRNHGKRLTHEERVAIVERFLTDPMWGMQWADAHVERITGENRKLVRAVRKDIVKRLGKEDPETRKAIRNGQVYEQKVPKRPDHAQDDAQDQDQSDTTGGDQSSERMQRRNEIDAEYLMPIPVRSFLHPDLLPAFDQAALADRDAHPLFRTLQERWLPKWEPTLGQEHPYVVAVRRFISTSRPVVVGDDDAYRHPWTTCRACVVDGLSTGRTPEGDPCPKCGGNGYLMKQKQS
jgi:hypothetical protein